MNNIINKTKLNFNRMKIKIDKHSPEILLVTGIVGVVSSAVMACVATTKSQKILEDKKKQIEGVHHCLDDKNIEYTIDDSKKDLTIIYAQTGIKLVKQYMPSVIIGSLSIASIIKGHLILNKRNTALVAAYTVVDKGFKKYRKNVIERFGNEIDKELRYNIKYKEVEKEIEDKNGKKKIKKEIIKEIENPTDNISEYARFFDVYNSDMHTKDPEYNLLFLRKQQDYANDKLKATGHLFLNEVYDMLGLPRSKAGQLVGWVYNKDNPTGDNYVDFNIYDPRNDGFVNGVDYNILLDFNVDGVIYDKLG